MQRGAQGDAVWGARGAGPTAPSPRGYPDPTTLCPQSPPLLEEPPNPRKDHSSHRCQSRAGHSLRVPAVQNEPWDASSRNQPKEGVCCTLLALEMSWNWRIALF